MRAWGRWYQRCMDCGMNLPDPMVLVSALTSMTKPVLRREPEVTWRTELVKSTLQLHGRPSEEAVRSYHRHLLAEFETLAGATVPVKPDDAHTPQLKAVSANDGGERPSGAGGKTCKLFLSPKGCQFGPKCRYQHSMSELSYAERARKCLNCGSEAHRAKDCTAGKSPKPDAQAPLCQVPTAMQEPVAPAASSTSSTSHCARNSGEHEHGCIHARGTQGHQAGGDPHGSRSSRRRCSSKGPSHQARRRRRS